MCNRIDRPVIAIAALTAFTLVAAAGAEAAAPKRHAAPHTAPMQSTAGESNATKEPSKGNSSDAGKAAAGRLDPLQDCLKTWDAGAHMTRRQWEETCRRTLMEHPTVLQATGLKEEGRHRR